MFRRSKSFVLMTVLTALPCCAPAPPAGIPNGADAEQTLKGGWIWRWERTLQLGCAAWIAKESWANVRLVVDSGCKELHREGSADVRGVSYSSVSDHLIFQGYWPWKEGDHFDLMVFDDAGMISDIHSCPHAISPEQIDALRSIAQEALAEAETDAERRVLTRIDGRLAATNGAALASGQAGCTDLPPGWGRTPVQRTDPWTLPLGAMYE